MSGYVLGLNERRFLEAYRRFYGEPYPSLPDGNQNAHVKGQKAIYLLMLKRVNVGDYGFTWQQHGPCSDELQEIMRRMDKEPEAVDEFYEAFPAGSEREDLLYSDDSSSQRIFLKQDADKIDSIKTKLKIPHDDGKQDADGDTLARRWMELLGSLTYISTTRLPGAKAERVWTELEKAKSKAKYVDAPEKEDAFFALREAGLFFGG